MVISWGGLSREPNAILQLQGEEGTMNARMEELVAPDVGFL